jgi:hypothetical protein
LTPASLLTCASLLTRALLSPTSLLTRALLTPASLLLRALLTPARLLIRARMVRLRLPAALSASSALTHESALPPFSRPPRFGISHCDLGANRPRAKTNT